MSVFTLWCQRLCVLAQSPLASQSMIIDHCSVLLHRTGSQCSLLAVQSVSDDTDESVMTLRLSDDTDEGGPYLCPFL